MDTEQINEQNEMDLLVKLLKESDQSTNDLKVDEFSQLINEDLYNLLEEVTIPHKRESFESLQKITEKIALLKKYPAIHNKHIIGTLSDSTAMRNELLQYLVFNHNKKELLKRNNQIPSIMVNSNAQQINVTNQFGRTEELTHKEWETIYQELIQKNNIDFQNVLNTLYIETSMNYDQAAVIDFPRNSSSEKAYTNLIHDTDCMCLLLTTKQWKKSIQLLKDLEYSNPVYIFTNINQDEINMYVNQKLNVEIVEGNPTENLKNYRADLNKRYYNLDFTFNMNHLMLDLIAQVHRKREDKYKAIERINKSIALLEDRSKGDLSSFRDEIKAEIDHHTSTLDRLEQIKDHMEQTLKDIYDEFVQSQDGQDNKAFVHPLTFDHFYKIAEAYIDIGKFTEAENYIKLLQDEAYEKVNLLLMKQATLLGKEISLDWTFLKYTESTDPEVLRAKVKYRDRLGLSKEEAVKICHQLPYLKEKDEYFLMGEYYDYEVRDAKKGFKYYHLAAREGSEEAGNRLCNFYKSNVSKFKKELIALGNALNNNANYILGSYYQMLVGDKKNISNAIFRFKLAGIMGHRAALVRLADYYYYEDHHEQAQGIYEFAIDEGEESQSVKLKLAICYFELNNYRDAFDLLKSVNSPDSHYYLGRMYEEGLGRVKDLDKALEHYKIAKNKGNQEAYSAYIKLEARQEEQKHSEEGARSYDSNASYQRTRESTSTSSGSSGCFLTTATCKALNKKDDCEEIIAFKQFRDQWLISQKDGPSMIKEYYKIAPAIVESINRSPDPQRVYHHLWDTYMEKGFQCLKDQDYERAKNTYIQMVLDLKEEYYQGH